MLVLIISLSLYLPIYASKSMPTVIDSIEVTGNNRTLSSIIIQEMELSPGSVADPQLVEKDRKRLESLGLFSRVQIFQETRDQRNILVVQVTELWYIWPGIYFEVDEDRPTERVDYGLILSHLNFRGRAEKLSIVGWSGSTHGGKFLWDIPYLAAKRNLFAKLKGEFKLENDPSSIEGKYGFKTEDADLEIELGKNFDLNSKIWFGGGIENRRFDAENDNDDVNRFLDDMKSQRELMFRVKLGYAYDTRHYRPWPKQGKYIEFRLRLEQGINGDSFFYARPEIQASTYHSIIDGLYIALKADMGRSIGDVPWFRNYLLDQYNGIRTPYEDDLEGINTYGLSAELRGDILPITYITFKTIEFFNPYTHDIKFGISWALFADSRAVDGKVEYPFVDYDLSKDGWDTAYGAGLIIHIPYREIIRLEYSRSANYPGSGYMIKLRIGPWF